MPRIALLSDTHGHLDDAILHYLGECDEIWHAGDFGTPPSKSGEKDGLGKINKISLDGKVMDSGLVPGPDQPNQRNAQSGRF